MGIVDKFSKLLTKVFGSRNERLLRDMSLIVDEIAVFEPKIRRLTNAQLRAKTDEFRKRIYELVGEKDTKSEPVAVELKIKEANRFDPVMQAALDSVLPEAFAVMRESARRVIGMRHFDVQMVGGITLHQGKIAEMVTGEGKTLVATCPAYLNGLTGDGVHVVTVNDYLARRDREWMGPTYEFLGLSCGVIQSEMTSEDRKPAYASDITYGTNNEYGFDYLRDNMKVRLADLVQRKLNFAVVDEVDSALVDEARTPLIISGPSEESTDKYYKVNKLGKILKPVVDYIVDEKEHTVALTEDGLTHAEQALGMGDLFSGQNIDIPHYIDNALRAHNLYRRDRDYVVKDGEVIIVDEFTGRMQPGRRWSDGLHQAIEAKEGLKIKEENQTLATITFQNYFRMYNKLCGMTGTAMTEAVEFLQIYKLDVVEIPTNKPLKRVSMPDSIYGTTGEKYDAIENEIVRMHEIGRPLLIGTISIEKSEMLSERLKRRGLKHEVLNAKHHEREAQIISRAGRKGNITIATNMAGRGTDIVLGEGVAELGGLHILATERHEARRIDNQLRGRCGRQGDPGSSQFFLSLEDDLMRIFASGRVASILRRIGLNEGQQIEHPMVSSAIARAQKKVEEHNFSIRKNLLEYDKVMDEQRTLIYARRQEILRGENLEVTTKELVEDVTLNALDVHLLVDEVDPTDWDFEGLTKWLKRKFGLDVPADKFPRTDRGEVQKFLLSVVNDAYENREKEVGDERMRLIERFVLLQTIDSKWKDHLYVMDHLKAGIWMRSYGERDPKVIYKKEGYELFENMLASVAEDVTDLILRVHIEEGVDLEEALESQWDARNTVHDEAEGFFGGGVSATQQMSDASEAPIGETHLEPIRRVEEKVGRNDPCPCGSGKKYKKCCGREE